MRKLIVALVFSFVLLFAGTTVLPSVVTSSYAGNHWQIITLGSHWQ